MSATREQASVMIAYLFQVLFERGEMLRKDLNGTKEGERHANIIHSLARSISILREDYGLYDRVTAEQPDAQPEAEAESAEWYDRPPDPPQTEPAEWDKERTQDALDTGAEPEEEPEPV